MRQPKNHALAPLISLERHSQKSISIANLLSLANNHRSFDAILDECLPDLFKSHFKINSFNDNNLVLTCTSAKLMTRFRFIQDQVIEELNKAISPKKVSTIQIKIRPNINAHTQSTLLHAPKRSLSKKNAQTLLEEAEHTEDQNLKKILTNLANNADR